MTIFYTVKTYSLFYKNSWNSQTFTNIQIDHWSVILTSVWSFIYCSGAQIWCPGMAVHSVELSLCHMLIVWISICTELSDTATLVYKNRSGILIVLLASHLSLRAACGREEDPCKYPLYYELLLWFLCTVYNAWWLFNFTITWNVFTFGDILLSSIVVLKALTFISN